MTAAIRRVVSAKEEGQDDTRQKDEGQGGKRRNSGGSGGRRVKSSHIISEFIDVGVPPSVAYAQWTQYDKWSEMFKKESADTGDGRRSRSRGRGGDGQEVKASAKIGPSERHWTAEIVERVPDRRIAWRAKNGIQAKGVTSFARLDDRLTHLMVEIEYRPSGLLETIGNFFRMQRRRVRKDLKLFKNYIELKGDPDGPGPGPLNGDGLREDVDQQVGRKREG